MYTATTHDVTITVKPTYLAQESAPEKNHFVWSYHVHIKNEGHETLCLKKRYWKITDAYGRSQEVSGPGVVGEQPVLKPGESFEYTSGTPLSTPGGIMVGRYTMEKENGENLDVAVPAFSLDTPDQRKTLN